MPYLLPQAFSANPAFQFPTGSNQPISQYGRPSPRRGQGVARKAVMHHKATPTCTLSLAHAQVSPSDVPQQLTQTPALSGSDTDEDGMLGLQLSIPVVAAIRATKCSNGSKSNEINVIPFPTSSPTSVSSRPLPIPPTTHALLRATAFAPSSPPVSSNAVQSHRNPTDLPKRVRRSSTQARTQLKPTPPPMQRRRSRDPNVADNLVVEDEEDASDRAALHEDVDGIPPRPSSPTPDIRQQIGRRHASPTSPTERAAPPAYSTLPPPYSASDYEEKKGGLVGVEGARTTPIVFVSEAKVSERQPAPIVVPLPNRTHKASLSRPSPSSRASASSSSAAYKRTRVSTSELKVLLYLYRTVVYGLEMRHRKEESAASAASTLRSGTSSPSICDSTTPSSTSTSRVAKKPLGPRRSPSSPSSSTSCSTNPIPILSIPPPEDKYHFESAIANAASKGKVRTSFAKAKTVVGFGTSPLVEEDDEVFSEDESEEKGNELEFVTPRTPYHTPSQSPRSSPSPLTGRNSPTSSASGSAATSRAATPAPATSKNGKTRVEVNAELDVQDALLAIRLKEFLRVQGVCEDDLRVEVDGTPCDDGADVKERIERKEMVREEPPVEEEEEEENILDEYFMGIEEDGEEVGEGERERGPLVEDLDEEAEAADGKPARVEDMGMNVDVEMDIGDPYTPTPNLATTIPPLQVETQPTRLSSPPPTSPSPRPRAVLAPSYMVALLTMRNRHPSRRVSSSGSGEKNGKDRKSGLRVVVEVD